MVAKEVNVFYERLVDNKPITVHCTNIKGSLTSAKPLILHCVIQPPWYQWSFVFQDTMIQPVSAEQTYLSTAGGNTTP